MVYTRDLHSTPKPDSDSSGLGVGVGIAILKVEIFGVNFTKNSWTVFWLWLFGFAVEQDFPMGFLYH